jgi:hypothetical protein
LAWGTAHGSAAEGLGATIFCEAELRFLLLFLEKEEHFSTTTDIIWHMALWGHSLITDLTNECF